MMLKLGLDSFSYRRSLEALTPREAVAWMVDKVVDLQLDGVQFDPMHLEKWNPDLVREIGSLCGERGLYLELGSGGFEYDHLLKRIELAAEVGARCVRTFISWERGEVGEEGVKQIIGFATPHLARLGPEAAELGVPIAVENHEDLTSVELSGMLDEIGSSSIRACVDTGNALSVGEDPEECVRRLAPYAAASHLKDWVVSVVDGKLVRTSAPFGMGDSKLERGFRILRDAQPDMPLTIEQPCLNPSAPVTPELEDYNVRRSVEFVRSLEN